MKFLIAGICAISISIFLYQRVAPLPLPISRPSPTPNPKPINIIFAGDLMMDRYIRQIANKSGYDYILNPLTTLFNQTDLVVANLEGPITDNSSVSLGTAIGSRNNYIFTFSPDIIPTLQHNRITLVNLGNNHILNFGDKGLTATKKYLDAAAIRYFGNTGASGLRYKIIELKQHRLAFVNYNQFVPGGTQAALEDIDQVKNQSDTIILYAHWDNEYQPNSSNATQTLAHQFIDAGADIIIGSHPHVVQQQETYHQKQIYYSLGNFVFDQYLSPQTQQGLLIRVHFVRPIRVEELPITLLPTGQTKLFTE